MRCVQCGWDSSEDAKFCSACGSQAPQALPNDPQIATLIKAGFWMRFGAITIDSVLLAIAGMIIGSIIGGGLGFLLGAAGMSLHAIQIMAGISGYIIGLALNWLYFTLTESSAMQATIGKMALGIKVADLNGDKIAFGRANGRYWGKLLSYMTLGIGFIMAGFTRNKQALHDLLAETLVVRK